MADGASRVVMDGGKLTHAQGKKRTKENGIPISGKQLVFNVHAQAKNKQLYSMPHLLLDGQSICGRFGWVSLGNNHLPYIMRHGERYSAVRMVEKYLLPPYLDVMNSVVYKNCVPIKTDRITTWEQRLLNEINSFHCDFMFGRTKFAVGDLVVRLNDLIEFYQFLVTCHAKLFNLNPSFNKFGFVLIDKTSTVPFVMKDSEKYLPLFYLDGAELLESKSVNLTGWDLAYLKLAFRVQRIRQEFIDVDTCACVPLSEVKGFFPPETLFQESWPKTVDLGEFIGNKAAGSNEWTWFQS